MKSSWAGAMGLTQFLPSDYLKYAVDFDGDGRADIWNSVPDALASAAKQLVDKGWQRGLRWAYEVHPPADVDCTIGVPEHTLPIGEWLQARLTRRPMDGTLSAAERAERPLRCCSRQASTAQPFWRPENYFAIKEYNFSDLYVLFVGHLSDRMVDPRPFETPWGKVAQLPTRDLDRMQQILTARGYYHDKIDGKAGMKTRAALGDYQKRNGLKVDCWPTPRCSRICRRRRELIARAPPQAVTRHSARASKRTSVVAGHGERQTIIVLAGIAEARRCAFR